jgi:hypothetical protein
MDFQIPDLVRVRHIILTVLIVADTTFPICSTIDDKNCQMIECTYSFGRNRVHILLWNFSRSISLLQDTFSSLVFKELQNYKNKKM